MIVDMIFILSWVIGLKRLVADRLSGHCKKFLSFGGLFQFQSLALSKQILFARSLISSKISTIPLSSINPEIAEFF